MKKVVKVEQEGNKSNVDWSRGDVPKFGVYMEIIIGERVKKESQAVRYIIQSVAFWASNHACLLHTIVNVRMERNLNQLRNVLQWRRIG